MKKFILIFIVTGCSFLCTVIAQAFVDHNTILSNSTAEQWPAANELFRMDPHWRGSDGASSLKVGTDRVLWLFGDTLISSQDKIVPRNPYYIKMPRNSIGIQTGLNPENSTIEYYWGNGRNTTNPDSFFSNSYIAKKNWLWPGGGVLLPGNKTLVIFFMNIMPSSGGLMFDIAGYQVAIIRNSDESPEKWKINWVEKVSSYKPLKVLIGSGGVLVEGDHLYAHGYSSADDSQSIYLARWRIELLEESNNPDLSNPEWWCGEIFGWIENSAISDTKKPVPLWGKGQSEFTVTKLYPEDPTKSFFMMVQTYPENQFIGNANLVFRTSERLTGPWSDAETLYYELCRDNPAPSDLMVYAGKLHPELIGGELVFTYATNTMKLETLWGWDNIYYPRFLRVP